MWVKGLITWSGPSGFSSSLMAYRKRRGRERKGEKGRGNEAARGARGVKMTLPEITTATLNVLHYKICDKTLLWGGP